MKPGRRLRGSTSGKAKHSRQSPKRRCDIREDLHLFVKELAVLGDEKVHLHTTENDWTVRRKSTANSTAHQHFAQVVVVMIPFVVSAGRLQRALQQLLQGTNPV